MNRCLLTAIIFMALSWLFTINVIAQVDSVVDHAVPETITDNLSQSKAEVELDYIYDFGKVFNYSENFRIRNSLEQIERDYNVKCVIVSVDTDSKVSQETASQLFKKWDVGETQQENILMLLFKEETDSENKKIYPSYVYVGKNLEKIFTPKVCKVIIFRLGMNNSDGAFDNVNQIVDNSFLPLIKGDISPEQYVEEQNQSIKQMIIFGGASLIIILWLLFYMRLWSYGRSSAAQSFREKDNL